MELILFSLEFWLILAVVCVLLELMTLTFFLLSISVGSLGAAIVNYSGYDLTTQLIVFIVLTVICILLSRPIAKKLTKNTPNKKANSDRLIGREAIVVEKIEINSMGTVDLIGDKWKAISNSNINVGERVIVKDIDGVKLIVEKKD
ncbi:MAG: NfeD family protein [Methanobrevibacter sp.]|jgi:membrane protein implicated in regulation of membrane protease activity|nr:NfeD family protein [Candidatus Methanoflexus mossambicus]